MASKPSAETPAYSREDLAALEYEVKLLELQEKKRAIAERNEREEQARLSREAGIEATRQQMRAQAQKEALCSHLKPNGGTQLAGQKDNFGSLLLICQMCQKHFRGNDVPPHLYPMLETVGGPH